MAIATLADVVSGLKQPVLIQKPAVISDGDVVTTQFYAAGSPDPAVAPTPGINGASLTSYAGQYDCPNAVSGNCYLAGVALYPTVNTASDGYWLLYDRLWHNSSIGITTTTEQAITSPAWPARDRNGATDGDGVFVAIEVSSDVGAGAGITNTTLNYTNSAGTSGRTGTLTSTPNTPNAGSLLMFRLQAGDVGIRSVEGLTLGTSWVSGTIHLVALRPITLLQAAGLNDDGARYDAVALGMPRLYDNSVLFSASCISGLSTTPPYLATLTYAHG